MTPTPEQIAVLATLYGCTPAELGHAPDRRELGQRMDRALKIIAAMSPDDARNWLEIGERLTTPKG